MELSYTASVDQRRLDRQLGIHEERVNDLLAMLEEAYNVLIKTKALGDAYKYIANKCSNLEEHTLCMHVFIFMAARSGELLSEIEQHINKSHMGNLIALPGLNISASGHISADPKLWTTQAQLSKKLGLNRNTLNNRVRRYVANGTIPDIYIKAWDIRLIPNVNNINELREWRKNQ